MRKPEVVLGCGDDLGDEGVEGGVAGAGGVAGDVGVVAGVGGDGGGGGVAVVAAEIGGVEEGGAGGVELFDEAVLQAAGGGVWMMAEGVTGRVEPKMLPVMKTASAVAAMEVAAVRPLPAKVTKMGFRFWSRTWR